MGRYGYRRKPEPVEKVENLSLPEKGVRVHGKENGKNLAVREAIQSRRVLPIETAAVSLRNIFQKNIHFFLRLRLFVTCLSPRLDIVCIRQDDDRSLQMLKGIYWLFVI